MRLGAYDLVEELGRGAMGVVYRGRHALTGADRAVKVISLDGADPEGVARFRREAEALARVDGHPNIVRVHETGIEGTSLFYAMELVPGRPLRALLAERGRLRPRAAMRVVAKVARALEHCHARGVIHRDVKPENVLVDEAEEPRLVDFGLVRDLAGRRLTHTGAFLGTPAYMAPEQIRGEPATAATDVHALGLLLYEALAGERPHGGTTVVDIADAILSGRLTPLEERVPELPMSLVDLVRRALSVQPGQRPRSALSFARELEAIEKATRRGPVLEAGTVRRARTTIRALVGVALLLGITLGGILVERRTRPLRAQRAAAERLAFVRNEAKRWFDIARIHAREGDATGALGAAAAARSCAGEALRLVPIAGVESRSLFDVHAAAARVADALGALPDVVAATESGLALAAPGDPEARALRVLRARTLLALGEPTRALEDMKSLPAAPGESIEVSRMRVEILALNGLWAEAIAAAPLGDPWVSFARLRRNVAKRKEVLGDLRKREMDPLSRSLAQLLDAEEAAAEYLAEIGRFEADLATFALERDAMSTHLDKLLGRVVDGVALTSHARFADSSLLLKAATRALELASVASDNREWLSFVSGPRHRATGLVAAAQILKGEDAALPLEILATRILSVAGDDARDPSVVAEARRRLAEWRRGLVARALPSAVRLVLALEAEERAEDAYLSGTGDLAPLIALTEEVASLPPLFFAAGISDTRLWKHIRAAHLCGRAAAESPAPVGGAFLARSEAHLAVARSLGADGNAGPMYARAELLASLVRGDVERAHVAANAINFELTEHGSLATDSYDLLLYGELLRHEGDAAATKYLSWAGRKAEVERNDSKARTDVWRWAVRDAQLANALVALHDPNGNDAKRDLARRTLRAALEARNHPPPLAWLEAEARRALAP